MIDVKSILVCDGLFMSRTIDSDIFDQREKSKRKIHFFTFLSIVLGKSTASICTLYSQTGLTMFVPIVLFFTRSILL